MKKSNKVKIKNPHGKQGKQEKHEKEILPKPEGDYHVKPGIVVDEKITICHATGSEKNPYIEIKVSAKGLNGHDKHEGDIIPAPEGGCPTTSVLRPENKGQMKKYFFWGEESDEQI